MPPPTSSHAWPPRLSIVRMATLSSSPKAGEAKPIAPQKACRVAPSSELMTFIAASFGAPVTEPGGNRARTISPSPTPDRRSAATSETRCQTPACGRTSARASTFTEPKRATRPRSLRTRSTIITFSARSLVEEASSSRSARDSASSAGRGRVPLIGALRRRSPRRWTNSSGERLATEPQGPERKAARSGCSSPAPATKRSTSGDESPARSRIERLAWNTSPAAIRSRHDSTAIAWPTDPGADRQRVGSGACGLTPRASLSARVPKRSSSTGARASVHSASNHQRPSASSRRRWS